MEEIPTKLEVKLQYLEALRLAAYNSFNDRRGYEWKLSLAIWSALAVVLAGLVQAKEVFPFRGPLYGHAGLGLGLLIVLLHIYFNKGMAHANAIDRLKERMFSELIKSTAGLEELLEEQKKNQERKKPEVASDLERLEKLVDELRKPPEHGRSQWRQWGHWVQILITALLASADVALFWIRAVR